MALSVAYLKLFKYIEQIIEIICPDVQRASEEPVNGTSERSTREQRQSKLASEKEKGFVTLGRCDEPKN